MSRKMPKQQNAKSGNLREKFLGFVRRFKVFSILCTISTLAVSFFVFQDVKAGKRSGSVFSPTGHFATVSIKTNEPAQDTDKENQNLDNQIGANPNNANTDIEERMQYENNNGNEQQQSDANNGSRQEHETNNPVNSNSNNSNSNGNSGNSGNNNGAGGNQGGTTNNKKQEPASAIKVSGSLGSEYCLGQTMDTKSELGKLKVVATIKKTGKDKVIPYGKYSFTKFDTSKEGSKQLTISYGGKSAKVSYGVVQWVLTLNLKNSSWKNLKPDSNLKVNTKPYIKEARQFLGADEGGYIVGWSLTPGGSAAENPFTMSKSKQTLYPTELSKDDYRLQYLAGEDKILIRDYYKDPTTIEIPNGIDYMSTDTFGEQVQRCTTLKIPSSVIDEYSTKAVAVAEGWSKLQKFVVDSSNPSFSTSNGVLYNKSKTTLLSYPRGKTGGYTILSSTKEIGLHAFYDAVYLTSIDIPSSVTKIGDRAFYYCERLKSITIRTSKIPSLGSEAFARIPSDAVIHVPKSLVETYENDSTFSKYTIQPIS